MTQPNRFHEIPFPVNVPSSPAGSLRFTDDEVTGLLGRRDVADVPSFTYPGPVKLWAIEVRPGVQAVLEFHVQKDFLDICCKPEYLDDVVAAIGAEPTRVFWRAT